MTSMLAAASIKVMDALFGFLAQNNAECCKRELLGRPRRRDIGACAFFDINFYRSVTKIRRNILFRFGSCGIFPRPKQFYCVP